MSVSFYCPLSELCAFVCVLYQIRVPAKNHIMCQTLVNLTPCCIKHKHQGPSSTKVPRLDRSIMSLSEVVHQMWRDHPFSQRNKTAERAVGVGVGDDREKFGQNLEKGGVGNIRGSSKIGVWG